ncbi:MAG: DegV family protein [Eubacterium sp.]|nr:DegV family protein [Eubacterium sp.]
MSGFQLSCCSAADLSEEYFKERDIVYLPFHFELGGEIYPDDMGKTISPEELFHRMDEGADTKTSQVTISEYTDYFRGILSEGADLLHVTLSSGLTGTYNSAMIAKEIVEEEYPDRKVFVVDSLAASSGYGLLVDRLADMRDAGIAIDEVFDWAEAHKREAHHWFFSTDLTYYIRGGRVSKTAGAIGTMLNICPLLNVDYEGHLIPREKVRTKKKVFRRTVEKMIEHAADGKDYSGKVFVSHSLCEDDAREVMRMVEETFPKIDRPIRLFPIGATIGSHTGPGTVALFFWGDERVN